MKIQIIKAKELIPKTWSGGTTTELFIYPKGSDYSTRNFKFRLSTATVEIEESIFTSLIDVKRTLMVLEGEMELNHKGQHIRLLGKFDVDHFNGSWESKSKGTCIDFNLMCQGETNGIVESIVLKENEVNNYKLKTDFSILYVYQGSVSIKLDQDNISLNAKDVLVLEGNQLELLKLHSAHGTVLISVRVNEED